QDLRILVLGADIVLLRQSMAVEGRPSARTRIIKTGNFRWIWVVQVSKCPAGADHATAAELISEFSISVVGEHICNRGYDGCGWHLRRAIDRSSSKGIRLIEGIRALVKCVAHAGGHMRAQTIFHIDAGILVSLIAAVGVLIKSEAGSIGQYRMQARSCL